MSSTTSCTGIAKVNDLIKRIKEACYYIPIKQMENISSGKPHAYIQGLVAGRKQVVDILEEYNNE
jgi:patatin-like phospholipase/acyl hydrolase